MLFSTRLFALLSVLIVLSNSVKAETNDVDLSLDFEHSIGNDGEWQSRGNKVRYVVNKSEKKLSVKFENPTFKLNAADILKLSTGWMRVRIPVVNTEGAVVPNKYLVTSVKGCALVQDPKEVFSLLTDKTGALIGLQYERPLISECSDKPLPTELEVASKVIAVLPKEAPSMPLPRIEADAVKEGSVGKDGEPAQAAPKSFLQEYWYLIVPSIVLYTIMTAPKEAPVDPAAAAAGVGASAVAKATGAAVAGTAAASGTKRRKNASVGQ
jgi:hypothetical protein